MLFHVFWCAYVKLDIEDTRDFFFDSLLMIMQAIWDFQGYALFPYLIKHANKKVGKLGRHLLYFFFPFFHVASCQLKISSLLFLEIHIFPRHGQIRDQHGNNQPFYDYVQREILCVSGQVSVIGFCYYSSKFRKEHFSSAQLMEWFKTVKFSKEHPIALLMKYLKVFKDIFPQLLNQLKVKI